VLKYGIEICTGLKKAHKCGVVHRDLKPGNIMLTKSGEELMDFGLAKSATAGAPLSSSLAMTVSGPGTKRRTEDVERPQKRPQSGVIFSLRHATCSNMQELHDLA